MRRTIAGLAAVLALFATTAEGCPEDKKPSGKASHAPAVPPAVPPGAGKGGDGKGEQPAPVQGDPSAHNTQPGELDLHVEWQAETTRTPGCEWSLNNPGVGNPCANIAKPEKAHPSDKLYLGFWEHETKARTGDVVWLSAQGVGYDSLKCSYHWKGQYFDLPDDGGRHCGGTATLS
jgi:hypothetical protein